MAHILVVEDEEKLARFVELELVHEGYEVTKSGDGREALDLATQNTYDLILLDIMLPGLNGLEVLRRLGNSHPTPVILLTARDAVMDKVSGLDAGAVDYITKPFEGKELVSRIQAVIRRSKGHAESVIKIGRMTVNLQSRRVEVDGNVLHLTGKEYSILELLCLRKGATLTKDMFLNHLYGGMDEPELKIIDVFVCKLRKKLMDALGGECYIETIWGRGYTIKDIDSQSSEKALNSPHELNAMSGVPGTI